MTFEVIEPVLVVGLGGVGSRLATDVKECVNADCIRISNDKKDLTEDNSIQTVSYTHLTLPTICSV